MATLDAPQRHGWKKGLPAEVGIATICPTGGTQKHRRTIESNTRPVALRRSNVRPGDARGASRESGERPPSSGARRACPSAMLGEVGTHVSQKQCARRPEARTKTRCG